MDSLKINIIVSILILVSFLKPSSCYPQSLDTLIHNYVNNKIPSNSSLRTAVICKLTLPSLNSSTIKLSVVRLRSGSLWARGQNISAFQMPPMIIPIPYVKRLVLVTSNLGNLSSHYFTPPQGYVFTSPVVGLHVYNASTTAFLSNTSIDIDVTGGPIVIAFDIRNNDAVCVGFGKDGVGGEVLGIMPKPGQCSVYNQGYVVTAVRVSSSHTRLSKVWAAGVVVGVAGVLVMCFVGFFIWRMVRRKRKRIKEMERQSEKEVGVATMWVGPSRLPTGNMCRTQTRLEDEMLP